MSIFATRPMANDWPSFGMGRTLSTNSIHEHDDDALGLGLGRIQTSTVDYKPPQRPPMRGHKSFPVTLSSSANSSTPRRSPLSRMSHRAGSDAGTENGEKTVKLEKDTTIKPSAITTTSSATQQSDLDDLAPLERKASNVTNQSAFSDDADHISFGDEDEDAIMSDGEIATDITEPSPVPKTAAELRAEKRKMKRFRLTHNQTRFLMSEFARQPHPDAAQRERLSREIPGLSSRQVQVWFQNRRAKLKRLTTDDRERMMKSRALPDDFDMTQALQSPFNTSNSSTFAAPSYATPTASPASYASTFTDSGLIRPLNLHDLRRGSEDENTISPISIGPGFGNLYATPPGSMPNSGNLSPISPMFERSSFLNSTVLQNPGNPSGSPFSRSSSFSNTLRPQGQIPRLSLRERVSRNRAESMASPLRSSITYNGNALDFSLPPAATTVVQAPISAPMDPSRPLVISRSGTPQMGGMPYSPGFNMQASANFARSATTTFPPGFDFRAQTKTFFPFSAYQAMQSFHGLQSAPLMAPSDFQLPQPHGFYHHATTQSSFAIGFGSEPESYYKSEAPSRRLIEEEAIDDFDPSSGVSQDGHGLDSVVEELDGENSNLQPAYNSAGRRRSFTHPLDFTSSTCG